MRHVNDAFACVMLRMDGKAAAPFLDQAFSIRLSKSGSPRLEKPRTKIEKPRNRN